VLGGEPSRGLSPVGTIPPLVRGITDFETAAMIRDSSSDEGCRPYGTRDYVFDVTQHSGQRKASVLG
jgi:hypothetical protein